MNGAIEMKIFATKSVKLSNVSCLALTSDRKQRENILTVIIL